MPEEAVQINQEVTLLYRRQEELEKEISQLKNMLDVMKENHSLTIDKVNQRIDELEEEVNDIREMLTKLTASIELIQTGVTNVQMHASEINAKQDIAITTQDKFISQLWKAFFILLGVITAGGTALVAFLER